MHLKGSTLITTAIIALSLALFGELIYDGVSETQSVVTHNAESVLRISDETLLHYIKTHHELQSLIRKDSAAGNQLKEFMKEILTNLRSSDIPATDMGVVTYSPFHIVAQYIWPPKVKVLASGFLEVGALRAYHSTRYMQVTSEDLRVWVPIRDHGRPIASIYVSMRTAAYQKDARQLFLHQVLLALLIVLLTVGVLTSVTRSMKVFRKEPNQVANWVQALVMDPFATPPDTLQVLDPLTRVILDMRSRVHLQEALLNTVVTSAPLGIIYVSVDGVVQMVNDTFQLITGLSESQVLNEHIEHIQEILDVRPTANLTHALHVLQNGEPLRNIDIPFRNHLTGEERLGMISVIPSAIPSNVISAYTIFVEDATTRRQWEAYIEHTDRLSLIAELAASTAHEIRNPLTTVRGFLQLQSKKNPITNGKNHFAIMINEIDRVDQLLREYLSLAKNPALTRFVPTNVISLLDELLPLITAEANLKGVEVKIGDLPDGMCSGNPSELKQVFLNLIKNALDATPAGGTVTIFGHRHDRALTIAVQDTGCGIGPLKIRHIFEPFFTTKPTGSGLGLSVCKRIIDTHQGTIDVESNEGIGTIFYVSLPLID